LPKQKAHSQNTQLAGLNIFCVNRILFLGHLRRFSDKFVYVYPHTLAFNKKRKKTKNEKKLNQKLKKKGKKNLAFKPPLLFFGLF
jgi:hypothetical protein